MTPHQWTNQEPWDYVLSTGRPVSANAGYIGVNGKFSVSEGYDGHIDFGENLRDLGEEFAADIWTVEERIELAEFMAERWRAFAEILRKNGTTPRAGD